MTEQDMVDSVVHRLCDSRLRVATEVPFMNQSIDLVYEDERGWLIAVEFKRCDWTRAVAQSTTHLLGADAVYICLPKCRRSPRLESTLREHGIGLMVFDVLEEEWPVIEIPADRPNAPLEFPRRWLREAFERRYQEVAYT